MKTNKETLHMLNTSMVEDNLFALLQCAKDSGMGGTEIDLLIRILSDCYKPTIESLQAQNSYIADMISALRNGEPLSFSPAKMREYARNYLANTPDVIVSSLEVNFPEWKTLLDYIYEK